MCVSDFHLAIWTGVDWLKQHLVEDYLCSRYEGRSTASTALHVALDLLNTGKLSLGLGLGLGLKV